jgi:hypothetical protein
MYAMGPSRRRATSVETKLTRRGFVKGAGLSAAALLEVA